MALIKPAARRPRAAAAENPSSPKSTPLPDRFLVKVPFDRLRPGRPEINARPGGGKLDLDTLAGSIASKGIIQPLTVRLTETDGTYEVVAGNRRLAAFGRLVKARRASKDDLIPVFVRALDDSAALDVSLTENVMQLPMHEVDQYEAFGRLIDAGLTEADVASAYAIPDRQVRQRLALGRLAPEVRDAWRKGKLGAAQARIFTLAPPELQAKVLVTHKHAINGAYGNDYSLRHALGLTDTTKDADFRFIGREAYLAAGGRLRDDLFGDDAIVESPEILASLIADRIAAECQRLVADDWKFALPAPDDEWDYGRHLQDWKRSHDPKDKAWTPEIKATHGCFVELRGDQLDIAYGIKSDKLPETGESDGDEEEDGDGDDLAQLDAGRGPGTGAAASPPPEPDGPKLPVTLSKKMAELRSAALAEAVSQDFDLALVLACAALLCEDASPCRLDQSGRGDGSFAATDALRGLDFEVVFARIQAMPTPERQLLFAALIGQAIDITEPDYRPARREHGAAARAVLAAARAPVMTEVLYARFDPAEFFDQAPKQVALEALAEMQVANVPTSAKKGVLAALAADTAHARHWLPPMLRGPQYDGPGAPAAAEKASAA